MSKEKAREEKVTLIATGLFGWESFDQWWYDKSNKPIVRTSWNPYDSWADCGMVIEKWRAHGTNRDRWELHRQLKRLLLGKYHNWQWEHLRLTDLTKEAICDATVEMLEKK